MKMYDIIAKKRDKFELKKDEIEFFINGYIKGEIPDYQVSALLMAMYLNGMTDREITNLTMVMARSGDIIDLSSIPGIKVDKHSTGGVGDKTTLVVGPIVAACGVPVAKMSGRGLGHTGGTIDKLESIPGFKTDIPQEKFMDIVKSIGIGLVGQSGLLAPADKKIYALRDVTATVESIGLIAASIMSKKIAAGCDAILLDVKMGSGGFMKTKESAVELANKMVKIGEMVNKNVIALITDMEQPLGRAIGNSLEVIEAVNTLLNKGPEDLTQISICLATNMLYLAKKGSIEDCEKQVKEALKSGKAFEKLVEMVVAQGGDESYIRNVNKFESAKIIDEVKSDRSGYISHIDAQICGKVSMILGAGRERKEDNIDYAAGILLKVKVGDYVNQGDILLEFHTGDDKKVDEAKRMILKGFTFSDKKPIHKDIVIEKIVSNNI